jgi:DNA-binding response OmpR family regulator
MEQPQPLAETPFRYGPTILIIDDEEAAAEVLAMGLQKQGFRTLTASSGTAGLALAQSHHPDLVILDICLPDLNGLAVCESLADSPATCTIPVIIISGLGETDIVRRARAAGCHYFLHKPYDPNVLLLAVRQSLREMADKTEAEED